MIKPFNRQICFVIILGVDGWLLVSSFDSGIKKSRNIYGHEYLYWMIETQSFNHQVLSATDEDELESLF